jgi:hypothetical protein
MKAQKPRGREKILSARIASIFVLAMLLLSAPLAQAVPITIEISGEVTDGYGSLWGGDIYEGALFTGVYTYDSSTPDTSERSDIGLYVHDSPYGLNVSLGGFEFKTFQNHTGQFNITITDNGPNADSYTIESNQNDLLSNEATVNTFFWSLHGPDSMISSTQLPLDAPTVSQWPDNILFIFGTDVLGNGYLIEGTVTQSVPEPSSVVLMIMGIFLYRRRR